MRDKDDDPPERSAWESDRTTVDPLEGGGVIVPVVALDAVDAEAGDDDAELLLAAAAALPDPSAPPP